jgi:hypothetical protein
MAELRKSNNIIVNTIKELNNIILNVFIKADKVINILRKLIAINMLNITEVD